MPSGAQFAGVVRVAVVEAHERAGGSVHHLGALVRGTPSMGDVSTPKNPSEGTKQ